MSTRMGSDVSKRLTRCCDSPPAAPDADGVLANGDVCGRGRDGNHGEKGDRGERTVQRREAARERAKSRGGREEEEHRKRRGRSSTNTKRT